MSLDAQESACREYCQSNGLQVVRVFVEQGESAKTADRTQLKEMLAFCVEDRNTGAVVFHKIDRFARNAEDYMQLRRLLVRMGVNRLGVGAY